MTNDKLTGQLYRLAHLYNVQTAYYGANHRWQRATVDSLLAVLRAMGAPVASLNDVPSALRSRRQSLHRRMMEPVTVVWDGQLPVVRVCLPASLAGVSFTARLTLESGESSDWKWSAGESVEVDSNDVEGIRYAVKEVALPGKLPPGYHRFYLEAGRVTAETLIMAAPRRTYSPPEGEEGRRWGTFLPLYALKTDDGWGSGDYSALADLAEWTAGLGGNVVATLPLLPAFLNESFDPSPYAPISRLLWNEFYIDINRVPELANCETARQLLQSTNFTGEISRLRQSSLVEYRRVMELKRRVMEELSRYLTSGGSRRLDDLQRFAGENPVVEKYAAFRAVMDRQKKAWPDWPPLLRDGIVKKRDYDESSRRYHLYAQWLAHEQIEALSRRASDRGVMLYFDLPLGVHSEGYDVWYKRDIFSREASVGAAPDPGFPMGQNWSFPPLHPEKIREQGYSYVIAYLRHHLRHARLLRIDHVMGLHRRYWIPAGMKASQGAYVRYRADELYAILAIESHRYKNIIVGEDLGTVPGYIRAAMGRHRLHRTYVLYYELADASSNLGKMPRQAVASLNTHDMPPFAAFWQGNDI
ncbi:MAG: 4-alpha-glucanotransferase, partial [Chloroflexota bacterium]